MESIKTKLMTSFTLLIGVICIGLGIISFTTSSNALKSNLEKTLPKIAEQAASNIQGRIDGELSTLGTIAARDDIKDPNIPWQKKLPILLQESKRIGSIRMAIVDTDGNSHNTQGGSAISKNKDYFKKALLGKSNVTDPTVSIIDKTIVVLYAVPIKCNNEIVGVLIEARDGNKLSGLTDQVKFGQTGTGFMINKVGTTIANKDRNLVLKMENMIKESKKDSSLQYLADIENKMIARHIGMGEYKYGGTEKYIGYAPVNGTDWSVGVEVEQNEILSELGSLKVFVMASSIIFILIGLGVIFVIANNISKGIRSTSNHLKLLAEGNLCGEISTKYLKSRDEVGDMTNSMKVMQESLKNMIKKIKENSSNINMQSENLSDISEEIANVSQNVTEAISQVAEGTSNQSQNLIHITDILNEFSEKLSGIVKEIQVVDSNSRAIGLMANDSSREMNELNQSVINVSSSFKEFYSKIMTLGKDINEINEITSLINSIAEQTNLLALNANIEAARAGEAGKGFSVVAEEIGELAEQSKDSSENISKLINVISKNADTIVRESGMMSDEMMNQAKIVGNSIVSFKKIVQAVDEVIPKIETVKSSAENIENDKKTILTRIDELSSISMESSSSSEEISASSEEMNASTEEVASSAQVLNNMTNQMIEEMNKFKI
ncbi:Methyl-accepting chemotaxis protein McpB [Clostridium ljungdahlii DSM 13528]|uniref:Methyl-accepting chemotaxis protein McpB n=1 Tax=Clostridium ljungdahlii (strain ATCC 55383 / DSM 13528 / PETC) TaxID=748727 RepID=D8GQ00_CLOLD|nr:methyl-accepting chemotaxis protein [Clostridium ljungdahlii]ADK16091.1 predicted methyl-accepting chemotaxis protein [Clostridium ljungdahlii DSM 13528]OAA87034.1 Methyl-accepting chemotaxis protein McpB [Clostridium ljungdahlii DSM 13528]